MKNIPCDTLPVRTLTYKNPKNPKASEERHEAICRFVDILTPQEIKGLTKFYAETWTAGEFYNYLSRDMLRLTSHDGQEYDVIIKNTHGISSRLRETKLHMSFRYKFQKFAYVLVSLAPIAQTTKQHSRGSFTTNEDYQEYLKGKDK